MTYLLKLSAQEDDTQLKTFLGNPNAKPSRIALIVIGCLRLLLKTNKKLIKHILKSLLNKEEYFKV